MCAVIRHDERCLRGIQKMSYCKTCGAYVPDWAAECPACGQPVKEPKKRAPKKQSTAKTGASASAAQAAEDTGEYRYTYKKAKRKPEAEQRWSDTGSGKKSARDDKGTFTYDGAGRSDKGTFRYESGGARKYDDDGYEYEPPRTARDYEREYRSDAKRNKFLAALCYFGPMFILSWLLKPKSRFVRYHVNQGLVFFLMCVIINIFDFIPFMWLLNIFSVVCFFCGVSNALKGKRKPLPAIGEITLIN